MFFQVLGSILLLLSLVFWATGHMVRNRFWSCVLGFSSIALMVLGAVSYAHQ